MQSARAGSVVVVIGASGTMGGCAVDALLARGAKVRVLVRTPERVAHLPPEVERIVGDSARTSDLARAFAGAKSVFYVSPHAPNEDELAANLVEVAEATGIRVVFAGVHVDGSYVGRAMRRFAYGLLAPHYRMKFRASERVRRWGKGVILLPANFAQNDEVFRDAILAGRFDQPLGHEGINRVDVRDVGEAAAIVCLAESFAPGTVPVCGPASLSGPECAAVWSRVLGREVRYGGDGSEWEASVRASLEGHKREDFLATFRLLPRFGAPTDPAQLEATTKLLGRPPRTYETYVRDTARAWLGRARTVEARA